MGFVEPWIGINTKLHCVCVIHGDWKTTSIQNFLSGNSCPECGIEITREKKLFEDSVHLKEFNENEKLSNLINFKRSDRLKKGFKSVKPFWTYECKVCSNDEYVKNGLCSGIFESFISSLKVGKLNCRCSRNFRYTKEQKEYQLTKLCSERNYTFDGWVQEYKNAKSKFYYICKEHGRQKITINKFLCLQGCPSCSGKTQTKAYINLVLDEDLCVALKFGIANIPELRMKMQNFKNLFKSENLFVFKFKTVEDCRSAETECLRELECGILSSREMADGWTETTSIQNLDKIIEIYKKHGGIIEGDLVD